ncbi:TetR family transcriptional regulator C-terminal domain-containing protein [Alteromonas halophila]|uniref:Transcriptional regulator n=1 Tax=Alteromonas halophila TaxID=516698 RepID=A0A918JDW5_9ALTE|nr:TetR family transcriptional regulator C-terminal domain-containing protein [Alteromonas halophila]GGW76274.1 transcriptional regulator [Alteromonas halophila]
MNEKRAGDARVGARNRRAILAAAEKIFAAYGFKGASVQQIADEAGLPKTNILYYFKTKQVLYQTLLEELLSQWNSCFDGATQDDDPAQILAAYIAEKMTLSRVQPLASKIFAMEVINGAANLTDFFNETQAAWMAGRVAVINAWIDAGKMAPVDAEFLLYQIWASTQHYADFAAQVTQLRGQKMRKEDFARATIHLQHVILTGCGLIVPENALPETAS